MKKLKILIALIAISLLGFSCSMEEQEKELIEKGKTNQNNANSIGRASNSFNTVYSRNSLVIRFATGVTDNQKEILREYYHVQGYRLCDHCDDNRIELWVFEDGVNIEPKVTTITNGPPPPPNGPGNFPTNPITQVDYQFEFTVASASTNNLNAKSSINATMASELDYVKDSNDGITIAVFDTGIDPMIDGGSVFPDKFLYNASGDGIPGIYSGWDFVNHDNNTFDDNDDTHGTVVTSIITGILDSGHAIPHQILPIKICDNEGKANYFDFLCATNFALERAPILQMSLGWYDNNSGDLVQNIFLDLMNDYPYAIIVSSAGNYANNNDVNVHLPSGYPIPNIFAIASCNEQAVSPVQNFYANISSFSNYGATSVDYFANGENINFLGNPMNGTSFASPIVSAIIARYIYTNPDYTIDLVSNHLFNVGIPCPNTFTSSKPVSSGKILIP